jgi:xanthine dehydrogenase large subunit
LPDTAVSVWAEGSPRHEHPPRENVLTTPLGQAVPHESAHLHVAGARPTPTTPELAGTLHAALGLSPLAHGVIEALDLDAIRALPGVVAVLSARDIPGPNDCGALVHDDPILAGEVGDTLRYLGQPVFAVVATTRDAARRAAAQAKAVIQKRMRCRRC